MRQSSIFDRAKPVDSRVVAAIVKGVRQDLEPVLRVKRKRLQESEEAAKTIYIGQ